ncbi:hypothetical protein QYF36_022567 [Acer negundo]|nr:hypothetical protein QYF36_022567 [Acer negundo]
MIVTPILELAGLNPNAESATTSETYEEASKGNFHHQYSNEAFVYSGSFYMIKDTETGQLDCSTVNTAARELQSRFTTSVRMIPGGLEDLDFRGTQALYPSHYFSSQLEQEDATTIPSNGEIVEAIVSLELSNDLSSVAVEDVEKEETEEKVKEVEDIPFEALLLYKELKLYAPPITFSSCLHKSKWNKWFSELISPHFVVNIYLPLFIKCRNMLVHKKLLPRYNHAHA